MTLELLQKYLQRFSLDVAKMKRLKHYYEGRHDILRKTTSDNRRPCNRLVINFPQYIADNFTSYIVGNPVTYSSQQDLTELNRILSYNDADDADTQIAKDLSIYGRAFELHWIDETGTERFKPVSPLEMFVIRDDTLEDNIIGAVRVIRIDNLDGTFTIYIEYYDNTQVTTYKTDETFSHLEFIERINHFYNDVPVVEYKDTSSFEMVLSLVDAYEKLASAEVDDYEAFVDAIMVLKGINADDEDAFALMEKRMMCIPQDASAEYLTKQVNTQQIEQIKEQLEQHIHKISNCPDFSSDAFATSSGIAMQYKLMGFTNVAKQKIRHMTFGLRRRLELIGNIISLTEGFDFREVQIIFTPMLPIDIDAIVNQVNSLRGLVSDKTLISQLPFVLDVDAELNMIEEQNNKEVDKATDWFANQAEQVTEQAE